MAPSLGMQEAVQRIEAVLSPTPDLDLHFATQQQVYDLMREAQALLDTRDFAGARLAAEAALKDAHVLIAPVLSWIPISSGHHQPSCATSSSS